jgi:uncharacterized protein (TIGR02246 family)
MRTYPIAMLLALGLIGWVGSALADVKSDVTATYGGWDAAFNRGDAKAVAAFYAADAKFLPADHSVHTGPADVEKFFAGLFANSVKGHKLEPITVGGTEAQPFAAAKWSAKAGEGRRRGRDPHL